jgi:hypothetical protein
VNVNTEWLRSTGDGFVFGCFGSMKQPFVAGEQYVIDGDINDWSGHYAKKVAAGLVDGGEHALYERLIGSEPAPVSWPEAAAESGASWKDSRS